ncbi:hypothetical protein PTTG_05424 [Puccinia triticina 1-1 BBBD Race 1]|uniref:Uncharacterized protein n=1 Tax=Puccinia triticina (isolate 1-1 / race 1 (BBBD)) TaxID=630390 RepID=A0A180GSS8_PUCT1|nr:hypothetical protein PTTG_05424 [Puccinia triticina 1-1 BBBD Race 1]
MFMAPMELKLYPAQSCIEKNNEDIQSNFVENIRSDAEEPSVLYATNQDESDYFNINESELVDTTHFQPNLTPTTLSDPKTTSLDCAQDDINNSNCSNLIDTTATTNTRTMIKLNSIPYQPAQITSPPVPILFHPMLIPYQHAPFPHLYCHNIYQPTEISHQHVSESRPNAPPSPSFPIPIYPFPHHYLPPPLPQPENPDVVNNHSDQNHQPDNFQQDHPEHYHEDNNSDHSEDYNSDLDNHQDAPANNQYNYQQSESGDYGNTGSDFQDDMDYNYNTENYY